MHAMPFGGEKMATITVDLYYAELLFSKKSN